MIIDQLDKKDEAEGVWYALNFSDAAGRKNREADEPAEVLIAPLSAREFRGIQRSEGEIVKGEKLNVAARGHSMRDKIIRRCVLATRGLEFRGPNGNVKPENGAALLKCLESVSPAVADVILDDILEAVQDAGILKAGVLEPQRAS